MGTESVMEGVRGAGRWLQGSGWGEFGVSGLVVVGFVMCCGKLLGMTPRCGNGFTASSFDS